MEKIFLISLLLFFSNCNSNNKVKDKNGSPVKIEIRNGETYSNTNSIIESNNIKKDFSETENKIGEIAISFHKWYIKATNDIDIETPISFQVKKDTNNFCFIDYNPYLDELKNIGTLSNTFMQSEIERLFPCANTISKMTWEAYNELGEIPEGCDEYLYWTNSQDTTDGVEFLDVIKNENNWNVIISLFNKDKDGKHLETNSANIIVIEKDKKYLIDEINWIHK